MGSPYRCTVYGSARRKATCYVHVYKRHSAFDNERWQFITLLSGPFGHTTDFRDRSIGDFTDIHVYHNDTFAISEEMRNHQFFLRNMDGQSLPRCSLLTLSSSVWKSILTRCYCIRPVDRNLHCCNIYAYSWTCCHPRLDIGQWRAAALYLLRLEDGDHAKHLRGFARMATTPSRTPSGERCWHDFQAGGSMMMECSC